MRTKFKDRKPNYKPGSVISKKKGTTKLVITSQLPNWMNENKPFTIAVKSTYRKLNYNYTGKELYILGYKVIRQMKDEKFIKFLRKIEFTPVVRKRRKRRSKFDRRLIEEKRSKIHSKKRKRTKHKRRKDGK